MADVLLSTPELSVLGGPARINLEVGIGAPGQRGSSIFFSNGNPNVSGNLSQTPQLLDIAINSLASDSDYGYMYQYQLVDGTAIWVKQSSILNKTYNAQYEKGFIDGVSEEIKIPLSEISQDAISLSAEDFNIQVTPMSDTGSNYRTASVANVQVITDTVDDIIKLSFRVYMLQFSPPFDSNSISAASGSDKVSITVTVGKRLTII